MTGDCFMSNGGGSLNLTLLLGVARNSEQQQILAFQENGGNITLCQPDEAYEYGYDRAVQITLLCLYVVSLILAVGGNLSILYIIIRLQSRSTTKTFICSLCLSDIILFLICVPVTVVSNLIYMYWPFLAALCPVVTFLQVTIVLQRAFTLLALTLDKHYVACKPLGRRLKHRSAKVIILVIWLLSGAAATPSAIYSKIIYLQYEPGSNGLCTEEWPDHNAQRNYSFALLALQYILPVVVMGFSYSHIGCIIWTKTPPGEKIVHRDKRLAKTKRKAVKMLMVVVLAYVVCWLPLHLLTVLGEQNPDIFNSPLVHTLWLLAHWLAMSNSAVNPLVYYWMNPAYRAGARVIFCRRVPARNYSDPVMYMMKSNRSMLGRIDSNGLARRSSVRSFREKLRAIRLASMLKRDASITPPCPSLRELDS